MARVPVDGVSLLVVAIVQAEDAGGLTDELANRGLQATRIASTGGFLIKDNEVVLVGTEDRRVDSILDAIAQTCQARIAWAPTLLADDPLTTIGMPVQIEVGGAVVFVLEVERCVRLVGLAHQESVVSTATRA